MFDFFLPLSITVSNTKPILISMIICIIQFEKSKKVTRKENTHTRNQIV